MILYELFTGELPWRGGSPLAVATARLGAPPPDPRLARPDLGDELAHLVMACMAPDPQARPAGADAVAIALAAASAIVVASHGTGATAAPTLRLP